MKKITIASILLILLSLTVYANALHSDLSQNILRLHIIANSDSAVDQTLKLKVRDAIIKEIGADFAEIKDKKEYRKKLIHESERIKDIADSILTDTGYKSKVSFERMYIPRKIYNDIMLPEGSYEALVVRLGKASGKNWWCVVYPPLCFTESTVGNISEEGKRYLKENLSPSGYSMILKKGVNIKYKFKIVELFQKLRK